RSLKKDWDRSVSRLMAAYDGRSLLLTADDIGQRALFELNVNGGTPRQIVGSGQVAGLSPARRGAVIAWASLAAPADLFLASAGSREPRRLTAVNESLLSARAMSEFEQFRFEG